MKQHLFNSFFVLDCPAISYMMTVNGGHKDDLLRGGSGTVWSKNDVFFSETVCAGRSRWIVYCTGVVDDSLSPCVMTIDNEFRFDVETADDGTPYTFYGVNATLARWIKKSGKGSLLATAFNRVKGADWHDELYRALGDTDGWQIKKSEELILKLWLAHPELGPYPCPVSVADLQTNLAFYANYRDHVAHSLKVFLLGSYLFEEGPKALKAAFRNTYPGEDETLFSDFLLSWVPTSLAHDVGYCLENELLDFWTEAGKVPIKQRVFKILCERLNLMIEYPLAWQFKCADFMSMKLDSDALLEIKSHADVSRLLDYEMPDPKIASPEGFLLGVGGAGLFNKHYSAVGLLPKTLKIYFDLAMSKRTDADNRERRAQFFDHGVAGAMMFLRVQQSFTEAKNKLKADSDLGLPDANAKQLQDIRSCKELKDDLVEDIAFAIAVHNMNLSLWAPETLRAKGMCRSGKKKQPISAYHLKLGGASVTDNRLFLSFFLGLSDTLQNWDRSQFKNFRIATKKPTSQKTFWLKANKNHISIAFKGTPASTAETEFEALKTELSAYLDPDAIGTLIEKGTFPVNTVKEADGGAPVVPATASGSPPVLAAPAPVGAPVSTAPALGGTPVVREPPGDEGVFERLKKRVALAHHPLLDAEHDVWELKPQNNECADLEVCPLVPASLAFSSEFFRGNRVMHSLTSLLVYFYEFCSQVGESSSNVSISKAIIKLTSIKTFCSSLAEVGDQPVDGFEALEVWVRRYFVDDAPYAQKLCVECRKLLEDSIANAQDSGLLVRYSECRLKILDLILSGLIPKVTSYLREVNARYAWPEGTEAVSLNVQNGCEAVAHSLLAGIARLPQHKPDGMFAVWSKELREPLKV